MENLVPKQLSGEAQAQFRLGIGLILSRWDSVQTAVQMWAGRNARQKVEQFPLQILARFNQTREPVYIDEVEDILVEFVDSLKTVMRDGSIEEVAEKIMIMHEDCLEGNFTSIERLNEAGPSRVSVTPHIRKGLNDDEEDDDSDSDFDSSSDSMEMIVDDDLPNGNQNDMVIDVPMVAAEDEEGWTVVASKNKTRGPVQGRRIRFLIFRCHVF